MDTIIIILCIVVIVLGSVSVVLGLWVLICDSRDLLKRWRPKRGVPKNETANKLLVKKVNEEWGYDVSLNGVKIPFVGNVKIIREEFSFPICVITIVAPPGETCGYEIIIEE